MSVLTKVFYYLVDLLYMCFGGAVILFVFTSVNMGMFGLPSSAWLALIAAFLTLLVLLIPYYLVTRIGLRNKKDLDDK